MLLRDFSSLKRWIYQHCSTMNMLEAQTMENTFDDILFL